MMQKASHTKAENTKQPFTLLIVLIHNEEVKRLDYIRPVIKDFIQKSSFLCEYEEVFVQEELDANFLQYLELAFRRAFLRIKVRSARERIGFRQATQFGSLGLFQNGRYVKRFKSTINAETQLSRKHIEAYQRFLKTNCQYLLILESDAIIPDVNLLISRIDKSVSDGSAGDLIMVGGHFSIQDLGIANFLDKKSANDDSFLVNGFFTNTTVAYVVSRRLARELHDKWPKRRLLCPCDWQIDELLRRTRIIPAVTLFFDPPLILNGSANGQYASEVR